MLTIAALFTVGWVAAVLNTRDRTAQMTLAVLGFAVIIGLLAGHIAST